VRRASSVLFLLLSRPLQGLPNRRFLPECHGIVHVCHIGRALLRQPERLSGNRCCCTLGRARPSRHPFQPHLPVGKILSDRPRSSALIIFLSAVHPKPRPAGLVAYLRSKRPRSGHLLSHRQGQPAALLAARPTDGAAYPHGGFNCPRCHGRCRQRLVARQGKVQRQTLLSNAGVSFKLFILSHMQASRNTATRYNPEQRPYRTSAEEFRKGLLRGICRGRSRRACRSDGAIGGRPLPLGFSFPN